MHKDTRSDFEEMENQDRPDAPEVLETIDLADTPEEEALAEEPAPALSEALFAQLQEQLKTVQTELDALKTQYDTSLRANAELDNLRKRAEDKAIKDSKFAIEKFATDLLAVKDSLEAALAVETPSVENLLSGSDLTLKQLVSAFEKANIVEVDPLGEKFDPNQHQAISTVDADAPANTVVTVLQKGYLLSGRILRPALVIVSKSNA